MDLRNALKTRKCLSSIGDRSRVRDAKTRTTVQKSRRINSKNQYRRNNLRVCLHQILKAVSGTVPRHQSAESRDWSGQGGLPGGGETGLY